MFEKAEAILGKKEADLLRRMAEQTIDRPHLPEHQEPVRQPEPESETASGNFSVDGVTVTGDTEDAT